MFFIEYMDRFTMTFDRSVVFSGFLHEITEILMKEALNTINQPTNRLTVVYSDEILYQIQIQTCLEGHL
jgi:hypothetical protein